MIIKPMRAIKIDNEHLSKIIYPVYGSPKIDGIRCIVKDRIALSNTLKPIRNPAVQELVQEMALCGVDGELTSGKNFQETSSVIMSGEHNDDFIYHIFDYWDSPAMFTRRWAIVESLYIHQLPDARIKLIQPVRIKNERQLLEYEEQCLLEGYEGAMFRSPGGTYKFGRSTLREQYLMKRKPFTDDEAIIIGFEEQKENTNELSYDERGYAKRSSHESGKVGKGTLGFFRVKNARWGEFKIGTGLGLTDELRQQIWENQDKYLHQLITFKYQPYGIKDKPRTPIFLRFRHEEDALVEL